MLTLEKIKWFYRELVDVTKKLHSLGALIASDYLKFLENPSTLTPYQKTLLISRIQTFGNNQFFIDYKRAYLDEILQDIRDDNKLFNQLINNSEILSWETFSNQLTSKDSLLPEPGYVLFAQQGDFYFHAEKYENAAACYLLAIRQLESNKSNLDKVDFFNACFVLHGNLGECYSRLNFNALAIGAFEKAASLVDDVLLQFGERSEFERYLKLYLHQLLNELIAQINTNYRKQAYEDVYKAFQKIESFFPRLHQLFPENELGELFSQRLDYVRIARAIVVNSVQQNNFEIANRFIELAIPIYDSLIKFFPKFEYLIAEKNRLIALKDKAKENNLRAHSQFPPAINQPTPSSNQDHTPRLR